MAFKRVTFTIEDNIKESTDSFRDENNLNMSSIINSLLQFNEEGLKLYIDLMCKYQKKDEFEISSEDLYCTNDKAALNKINLAAQFDSIDSLTQAANENMSDNLSNMYEEQEEKNTYEYLEGRIDKQQEQLNRILRITILRDDSVERRMEFLQKAYQDKLDIVLKAMEDVKRITNDL